MIPCPLVSRGVLLCVCMWVLPVGLRPSPRHINLMLECSQTAVFGLILSFVFLAGLLLGHSGRRSGSRGLWGTQRFHHYHRQHSWKGVIPDMHQVHLNKHFEFCEQEIYMMRHFETLCDVIKCLTNIDTLDIMVYIDRWGTLARRIMPRPRPEWRV